MARTSETTAGAGGHSRPYLARVAAALVVGGMLVGMPAAAIASEKDIHLAATWAIALADSWTWEEARTISGANQGVDDNKETAAGLELDSYGKPRLNANSYTFHGFSQTDDEAQAAANDRNQDVKDRLAAKAYDTAVAMHRAKDSHLPGDATSALIAIGSTLHYQQDTWSHSGYGGTRLGHGPATAVDTRWKRTNPDHPAVSPEKTRSALQETLSLLDNFMWQWKDHGTDITAADLDPLIAALTDADTKGMSDADRIACNTESAEVWVYEILAANGKLSKVPLQMIGDYADTNATWRAIHTRHFGINITKRVIMPVAQCPKYRPDGTPRSVDPATGTYGVVAVLWDFELENSYARREGTAPNLVAMGTTVRNDGVALSPGARLIAVLSGNPEDEAGMTGGVVMVPPLAPGQTVVIPLAFTVVPGSDGYCAMFHILPPAGYLEAGNAWWDDPSNDQSAMTVGVPGVCASFLLGDTFTFNEDIAPGAVAFDTTTALVKNAQNLGRGDGGEGVIPGDTLVYWSTGHGDDTRVDLVFRVWPGPGNYSGRNTGGAQDPWELRHHPLLKVPSAGDVPSNHVTAGDGSWWGSYMADNGEVGSSPSGHTATYWDPQTWNSARMDSAQWNYAPLTFRSDNIGTPVDDTWMGTYHESDPKYSTLGIARRLCFLVNMAGLADNTNTCCSAPECAALGASWPPAGYPGTDITTTEGTKIVPDGLFTPGTLVQYFVRRSPASMPHALQDMSPDTSMVSYQGGLGGSTDLLRYDHMNVLPDMWKDQRFGGSGLACILYVDAADGRGVEPSFRGALDTLGYGKDDGSERGWKQTNSNWNNVDNASGFVAENRGSAGLAYDKFDVRAAGAGEGDRPGCRLASDWVGSPNLGPLQCKQGPSPAMLAYYYKILIWGSGDLDNSTGAMHDGSGVAHEQSDDAGLIRQWLASAGLGSEKAFWGSGDGLAQDMNDSGAPSMTGLLADMGTTFVDDNYYTHSGNLQAGAVFKPLDVDPGPVDAFHSSRRYGILNSSLNRMDVVDVAPWVATAARAARYEESADRGNGGAGPYYASVYRRIDQPSGQHFTTLLDGFSLGRLRAWNGANDPQTQNISLTYNNHAQFAWLDDALMAFALCARPGPVIGIGETPGLSAVNFVRGAVPNPSAAGTATVQFTLAQSTRVSIRFYNVAGGLVHEAKLDGVVGVNSYRWNGSTSTGMRAAAGVYFYRLSAPGIEFQNNGQRMVLLGRTGQ